MRRRLIMAVATAAAIGGMVVWKWDVSSVDTANTLTQAEAEGEVGTLKAGVRPTNNARKAWVVQRSVPWGTALAKANTARRGLELAELSVDERQRLQTALANSAADGHAPVVGLSREVALSDQDREIAPADWVNGLDGNAYAVLPIRSAQAAETSVAVQFVDPGAMYSGNTTVLFSDRTGKVIEEIPLRELNTPAGPRYSVWGKGEELYLVLKAPRSDKPLSSTTLRISRVNHNIQGFAQDGVISPGYAREQPSWGDAGGLNAIPAECAVQWPDNRAYSDAYRDAMNASVEITYIQDGFNSYCSGTVVRALDGYALMTAAHCVPSQATANTLAYLVNYRASSCDRTETRPDFKQISGGGVKLPSFDGYVNSPWNPTADSQLVKIMPSLPLTARKISLSKMPPIEYGDRFIMLGHPGGRKLEILDLSIHSKDTTRDVADRTPYALTIPVRDIKGTPGEGLSGGGVFHYNANEGRYELVGNHAGSRKSADKVATEIFVPVYKPSVYTYAELLLNTDTLKRTEPIRSIQFNVIHIDDSLFVRRNGQFVKEVWASGSPQRNQLIDITPPAYSETLKVSAEVFNGGCWSWGGSFRFLVNGEMFDSVNLGPWFGSHCGSMWSKEWTIGDYPDYAIRSRWDPPGSTGPGKCLDASGSQAGRYDCHYGRNQTWHFFKKDSSGYYGQICSSQNQCLNATSVAAVRTGDSFLNCTQSSCYWKFDGEGRLRNKHWDNYGNYCLSSEFGDTYVQMQPCGSETSHQKWQAEYFGAGTWQ